MTAPEQKMNDYDPIEEYNLNPDLGALVEVDSELKNWLVEYVGNKVANDSPGVTVEMIVNVVADEFPEFMLAIAEENFVRGYDQALTDLSEVRKLEKMDEETSTEDKTR
jgi:hypothetical protein